MDENKEPLQSHPAESRQKSSEMSELAKARNGRLPGYGDAEGDDDELFEIDPLELDPDSLAKRKMAEKKREHNFKSSET